MADKAISDLPSVSTLNDSDALVIEQGNAAKKGTIQGLAENIRDKLIDAAEGYMSIQIELGDTSTDVSFIDIVGNVASGVPVYLFVEDTATAGEVYTEVYRLSKLQWTQSSSGARYAWFTAANDPFASVHYVLYGDGSITRVDDTSNIVTSRSLRITSPGTLRVYTEPTTDYDVATKKYVDDSLAGFSGGVSSVNNQTGDVTIAIPSLSKTANLKGNVLSYTYGNTTFNFQAADFGAYPLIVTYDAVTGVFNSSFREIETAWGNGRTVYCDISCGNSVFRAELKRHHNQNGGNTEYYTFEYAVLQPDDNEYWYGHLSVSDTDYVNYVEGSMSV